jgi:hypothetical protein
MVVDSIKIWQFHDAPKELRNMSISGGDEDYLALIPPNYVGEYFGFLDSESFGCCSIYEIKIDSGVYKGYLVLIGTHA